MSKLVAIVLFTVIEGVAFFGGVALWFSVNPLVGTAWWLAWTLVEHVAAYNVGAGKPFFSIP